MGVCPRFPRGPTETSVGLYSSRKIAACRFVPTSPYFLPRPEFSAELPYRCRSGRPFVTSRVLKQPGEMFVWAIKFIESS